MNAFKKLALILILLIPSSALATDGTNIPSEIVVDCLGVVDGNATIDICGICGGDGTSCLDCAGIPFGNTTFDVCGICGGDGTSCGITLCEELLGDTNFYRPGMQTIVIPSGCERYQFGYEGWTVVATNCPGFAPGRIAIINTDPDNLFFGCARMPGFGCFPPEAKILTTEGQKRIDSLKIGDKVLNPITGSETTIKKVIQSAESDPLIRLGFDGVTVTVTQTHPIYTEAGIKKASELERGDRILGEDGALHSVSIIEKIEPRYGQKVYNLVLDTPLSRGEAQLSTVSINGSSSKNIARDNLILSDGIVTGDMVIQNMINQK